MKRRIIKLISIAAISALGFSMLAGCQKEEKTTESPTSVVSDNVEEMEEEEYEPIQGEIDTHEGEAKSYLTGKWMKEDVASLRPWAVMYGNTNEAGVLPQAGIGSADLYYEITVEGGLTRIMALFQNYKKVEKFESIRSCRLYFLEFAAEYEAIYGHFGQSKYAKSALSSYDDLDGQSNKLYGVTYFRDDTKKAPHNGYATGEGVVEGIKIMGYDKNYSDGYEGHFKFAEDESEVKFGKKGDEALKVEPGYVTNKPWFEYDEENKVYNRFEYGAAQTDALDGEQITVKNIILQYMYTGMMDEKTLNISTVGDGEGKYITNGKAIDITWSKDSSDGITHYYKKNGEEITLNQGKTWICVVDSSKTDAVNISGGQEEQ